MPKLSLTQLNHEWIMIVPVLELYGVHASGTVACEPAERCNVLLRAVAGAMLLWVLVSSQNVFVLYVRLTRNKYQRVAGRGMRYYSTCTRYLYNTQRTE